MAAAAKVQASPEPSLDPVAIARSAMRDMAYDMALQIAVVRCYNAGEPGCIIDALLLLREEHGFDNSMFQPKGEQPPK
jgi:hypothetical protein